MRLASDEKYLKQLVSFYIQLGKRFGWICNTIQKKLFPKNIVTEFENTSNFILQSLLKTRFWHGLSRKEGKKETQISVSAKDGWLFRCNRQRNWKNKS